MVNILLRSLLLLFKLYELLCNYENPLTPFIQAKEILENYKGQASEEDEEFIRLPLNQVIGFYKDKKISFYQFTEILKDNFGYEGCVCKLKENGFDPKTEAMNL